MKKQTKTSTTAGARAIGRKIRAGTMAGFVAAALLAATGCPTEVEYKEVPTYPEITIPVRLLDKTIDVKCPGDLINESYSKINDVALLIEGGNSVSRQNKIISLLSNKTVTLGVNRDDNSELKEASDSYTMSVGYEWLTNTGNIDTGIKLRDTLLVLYDRYDEEENQISKAAENSDSAKDPVRMTECRRSWRKAELANGWIAQKIVVGSRSSRVYGG
jgi:hypothetical protein